MRKHTKGFLSAVASAALCIASVPLQTVNADIIIDHNSSGIDKGYYFEIVNNDKDSQPEFHVNLGGNYICRWDNDEDFSAARGLKFASPVRYSELGEISYKYWKRIDIESISDKDKAYVRFGVRLHNAKGDVFDILEIDTMSEGSSITEKDKKIGSLDSYEVLNDYSIAGPSGERVDVAYSIYARENADGSRTFICRRNEPMSVNNEVEDDRRINVSEKLAAIVAAGYDPGEITDVGLFLESAYSKGEAVVYTYDLSIENMPEIAPDEYEDAEAPLILKDYDYGVRTGYYYAVNSRFASDHMEVIAPSSFKAEWDASENKYNNDPEFERGKQYERGQSYKAVAGSSIDYTMNFDVEGTFAVSTLAKLAVMEMPDYYLDTEIYIVDACSSGWKPSEYAKKIGSINADGTEYDIYDSSMSMIGTGKKRVTQKYYFIDRNAEENGLKGKITAKHDLGPYMDYVHDLGVVLGNADVLVAQMNGGISKGSAELVKVDVTVPDYIADDGEYERETRWIDVDQWNRSVYLNGLTYAYDGSNLTMKGYAGEKINCEWGAFEPSAFSSNNTEYSRRFEIGMSDIWKDDGSFGFESNESLMFDYNIDIGEVTSDKKDPKWVIGGYISCLNMDGLEDQGAEEYYGCNILIADKWDGDLTSEFAYGTFHDPQELGTIVSNGVKYDVIAYIPKVKQDRSPFVIVKRQEQLKAVEAEDVEKGCTRYEGSFDAADIVRKVSGLGIDTYCVRSAYFALNVLRNTGSAAVNSVSVKREKNESAVYTADDIRKLTDFLLGKETDIPAGTDYDLNGDRVWDTFDLCSMRKIAAKQ
ncbi:glycoside hydrolase family 11 protein [Ruminococcus sp.]|uniref:glycoside hydrolase family 11 protein n=1 Tax=Ruminococcus sp. TaxID=41978 RepID=UPI0025FC85B0|nr:glycoside hydrolase family 11 protein [Ruminococcus sp.]